MSGITKFVSDKSREEGIIKHFEKLCRKIRKKYSKEESKKAVRETEMHILRPKAIERYDGIASGHSLFKQRSILFVFKELSQVERISRLFRVSTYVQNNTYDTDFLNEIIRLLESERLVWNNKKNRYYLITKNGRKIRL